MVIATSCVEFRLTQAPKAKSSTTSGTQAVAKLLNTSVQNIKGKDKCIKAAKKVKLLAKKAAKKN